METSLTGKALDFGSNEYGFESRVSKTMNSRRYLEFIIKYNTCVKKKKNFFTLSYAQANFQLAQLFARLGLVRISHSSNQPWFLVLPIYSKVFKETRLSRLTFYSSKPKPVSLKALQILHYTSPLTQLVLSTPYGVLTSREAVSRKTGGLIHLRLK